MSKIQKISLYLSLIFNALLVITPLIFVLRWLFIETSSSSFSNSLGFILESQYTVSTPDGTIHLNNVTWTPMLKLLGFSADIMGVLPFMISLFFLKSLFSRYKNGEIFTQQNARIYNKLGILYLIKAFLATPLSEAMLIFAATFANPPGHRYLSISFSTSNLSSLFYGVLVIVISWVMLEASKIHEENKFTV